MVQMIPYIQKDRPGEIADMYAKVATWYEALTDRSPEQQEIADTAYLAMSSVLDFPERRNLITCQVVSDVRDKLASCVAQIEAMS